MKAAVRDCRPQTESLQGSAHSEEHRGAAYRKLRPVGYAVCRVKAIKRSGESIRRIIWVVPRLSVPLEGGAYFILADFKLRLG